MNNEDCNYVMIMKTLDNCCTGHDATSETGDVEIRSFDEENRNLSQQPILHLHDLNA